MVTIVRLARLLQRSGVYILEHVKSNGGFAVAFVVVMLMLHCGLLAAGVLMNAHGDPALLEAALRSAVIVGPLMTAASVAYRVCEAARTKPKQLGSVPCPK